VGGVSYNNMSDNLIQSSMDVELLSAWFCPYAARAVMALGEKCPGQFTLTQAMKIKPPKSLGMCI